MASTVAVITQAKVIKCRQNEMSFALCSLKSKQSFMSIFKSFSTSKIRLVWNHKKVTKCK
mgnify:CR=1 FL=1